MCLQSGPGPVRSVHPKNLYSDEQPQALARNTMILHWSGPWFQSKIMVQINNTVYPRNVQQKHQIWSFNNFCKNITCTQQAIQKPKPPFLFLPLLGRFCGLGVACPFLQRDSMAAQATQGHRTVGSVHHYARVNWKALSSHHNIWDSGPLLGFKQCSYPLHCIHSVAKNKTRNKNNPCELIGSDSYSNPSFYPHSSYQFIRIQYLNRPKSCPYGGHVTSPSPCHGTLICEGIVSWFLNLSRIFRLWGTAT